MPRTVSDCYSPLGLKNASLCILQSQVFKSSLLECHYKNWGTRCKNIRALDICRSSPLGDTGTVSLLVRQGRAQGWHVSTGYGKVEGECKNGAHQCLHPWRPAGLFPSSWCFTNSKWIFFTYSLGTFQTTVFALGPGSRWVLQEQSQFATEPEVLWMQTLLVFKGRYFEGLSLRYRS